MSTTKPLFDGINKDMERKLLALFDADPNFPDDYRHYMIDALIAVAYRIQHLETISTK